MNKKKVITVTFVIVLFTVSTVYGHIAPNVKITGGTKAQQEKIQKAVEEIAKKSNQAKSILNRTKNLGRNVTIHVKPNTTIAGATVGGSDVDVDPGDVDKFKLDGNKTGKALNSSSLGIIILHELKHILGEANETKVVEQINKVRAELGLPKRHHYYLKEKGNTLYLEFCDDSTVNVTDAFVTVVEDPGGDYAPIPIIPEVPRVVDISPKAGATGISIEETIVITFSVPMNRESVIEALESSPEMEFSQILWLDSKALILTPRGGLDSYTTYTITMGTGAMDVNGNHLVTPYSWKFKTEEVEIEEDTIPPEVRIMSPSAGETVIFPFLIEVSATDNFEVVLVEFYVDGELIFEDKTSPYSTEIMHEMIPPGSHFVYAVAYDSSGNKGTSGEIEFFLETEVTEVPEKEMTEEI